MEKQYIDILHAIASIIEVIGVAVIVLSAAAAIGVFLYRCFKTGDWSSHYHSFRSSLAMGILLGLEFLVAGDIVGTVTVQPSLENLYVLGLIVLIRTFLSFSLEIEIDGTLPWKKGKRVEAGQ